MYYNLNIKDRINLMKSYRKAYPDFSYDDMIKHFNSGPEEFQNGGKVPKLESNVVSIGPPDIIVKPNPITGSTKYQTISGAGQKYYFINNQPVYKTDFDNSKFPEIDRITGYPIIPD